MVIPGTLRIELLATMLSILRCLHMVCGLRWITCMLRHVPRLLLLITMLLLVLIWADWLPIAVRVAVLLLLLLLWLLLVVMLRLFPSRLLGAPPGHLTT